MRTPEPQERDDPLNADLDRVEELVLDILARGGGAPLRARLARLLAGGEDTATSNVAGDTRVGSHDVDAAPALGAVAGTRARTAGPRR